MGVGVGGLPTHLHMVSTSMPENPKALSPSTQTILRPLSPLVFSAAAAAIAKPRPTPIVPNVPASNLHIVTTVTLVPYVITVRYSAS